MNAFAMADEDQVLWWRLVQRVVIYDVCSTSSLVLIWTLILAAADLRVLGVAMLVRLPLLLLVFRQGLRPLMAWEARGAELEDVEVIAAERTLSREHIRFVWLYCGSSLFVLSLATWAAYAGVPQALPLGTSDLFFAALFGGSAILGAAPVLTYVLEAGLAGARHDLGFELAARGLLTERREHSLVTEMLAMQVAVTVAVYVGVAAIGCAVHLQHLRTEQTLELRHQLELMLIRAQFDTAEQAGFVFVTELPSELGLHERGEVGVRTGRDARRGELVVALAAGDRGWLLGRTALEERFGLLALVLVVTAALVTGSLLAAVTGFARRLATPLRALRRTTRRIAEEGALHELEPLVSVSNDEVGALVQDFNAMLSTLRELALAAERVAAGDLSIEIEGQGEVHAAFGAMILRLRELVIQIRSAAVEVAGASSQIIASVAAQEQTAEGQLASITGASAGAASLAELAHDIAMAATHVLDDAEHGLETTESVAATILAQRSAAEGITELLQLIREIADRSDLIALNGALEAGRVGEQGRGFALIADEMRRLAERVTGTVADVGAHVKSIERTGAQSISATDENRRIAERTTEAARTISELTQRQALDTDTVLSTIIDVADGARATVSASSQTRTAARALAQEAARLERLTKLFVLGDMPAPIALPTVPSGPSPEAGSEDEDEPEEPRTESSGAVLIPPLV